MTIIVIKLYNLISVGSRTVSSTVPLITGDKGYSSIPDITGTNFISVPDITGDEDCCSVPDITRTRMLVHWGRVLLVLLFLISVGTRTFLALILTTGS